MALSRRVEVLFDPDQFRELQRISRAKGETVGALVRKAVEQQYLQPTLEERQIALQHLLSMRSDVSWEEARETLESDVGRRFETP